ncbi:unnamed protein product [Aphanomyces euteiches]
MAHGQVALDSAMYKDRVLTDARPGSPWNSYLRPQGTWEKRGCKWGGRGGAVCGAVVGGAAYGAVGGALGSLGGPVGAAVGAGAAATIGAVSGAAVGRVYGSRKGANLGQKLDNFLAQKNSAKAQAPTASNGGKSLIRSHRLKGQ